MLPCKDCYYRKETSDHIKYIECDREVPCKIDGITNTSNRWFTSPFSFNPSLAGVCDGWRDKKIKSFKTLDAKQASIYFQVMMYRGDFSNQGRVFDAKTYVKKAEEAMSNMNHVDEKEILGEGLLKEIKSLLIDAY